MKNKKFIFFIIIMVLIIIGVFLLFKFYPNLLQSVLPSGGAGSSFSTGGSIS